MGRATRRAWSPRGQRREEPREGREPDRAIEEDGGDDHREARPFARDEADPEGVAANPSREQDPPCLRLGA